MSLYLRKVIHPQAHENYIVILKLDGDDEIEVGPIGIQHGGVWTWAIDTVIPMRTQLTQGEGTDRKDCCGSSGRLGTGSPPTRSGRADSQFPARKADQLQEQLSCDFKVRSEGLKNDSFKWLYALNGRGL